MTSYDFIGIVMTFHTNIWASVAVVSPPSDVPPGIPPAASDVPSASRRRMCRPASSPSVRGKTSLLQQKNFPALNYLIFHAIYLHAK